MKLQEIKKEASLTTHLFSNASKKKIPLSGTFELSPVCNFSCEMCYVRKSTQEVKSHLRPMMSKEQWIQIANEAKEQGMLYLLLTGGEPLLWPDFWELYEKLVRMGFVISINTNGSLIDNQAVEQLKKNVPSRINITLYGANDETYEKLCGVKNGFHKVDNAITKLKEAGIAVKLNCSLTPKNAKDLEAMIHYAESKELVLSINTYMFPPLRRDLESCGYNCGRFTPQEAAKYDLQRIRLQFGASNYERFLRNIHKASIFPPGLESCVDQKDGKIQCRAGNASFWITWDGLVTPCGMMPKPEVDLTGRSFRQVWQELVDISQKLELSGVCKKCQNRELCHSCAAMALAETGDTAGIPKYLCEMVEELRKYAKKICETNSKKK